MKRNKINDVITQTECLSRRCHKIDLSYNNWKLKIYRQIVTHAIVQRNSSHYHKIWNQPDKPCGSMKPSSLMNSILNKHV